MQQIAKFAVSMLIMGSWGPYLLYVWAAPTNIPNWVQQASFRRLLMLGRDYEPTVFTLCFGLGFTGIALVGLLMFLLGKTSMQREWE